MCSIVCNKCCLELTFDILVETIRDYLVAGIQFSLGKCHREMTRTLNIAFGGYSHACVEYAIADSP